LDQAMEHRALADVVVWSDFRHTPVGQRVGVPVLAEY
jgi:hypothetical protein